MIVTLPDSPAVSGMTESDIRLELACTFYAQGRMSSQASATFAGVTLGAFFDALRERRISRYTNEMLVEDIESLNRLFPDSPMPLPAIRG